MSTQLRSRRDRSGQSAGLLCPLLHVERGDT
ncbi:hypothetical protein GQ607_004535 [Colletotrichum asianum]|uniref:Uncharacterized protein n=1 Tax=Colletotrichum asianum TaxID=702518 RepID=A0A8H3WPS1_9PEZI|nr:hypothetical protein GQ607_004535 [Colletotrichum asianum]